MSLRRKKPLQSKRKATLKRSRLAPMSAKRQRESKEYSCKRKAFLLQRPTCEICYKRASQDVHHVHGRRNGNFLNEATWKATCRICHQWLHTNPKLARMMGHLAL